MIRLSVVFVDWDNLRLSLIHRGINAGPEWVLRALMQAVGGHAATSAPPPDRIELHFTRATESRSDQHLLERGWAGARLVVELAGPGKNLADMKIAVGVADTWHEQPATMVVVSSDNDIAYLVRHYAEKTPNGSRVTLLHPHRSPPAQLGAMARKAAHRLELGFNDNVHRRPWTEWDRAAWTLRRLARRLPDPRLASGLLSGYQELWAATSFPDQIDWRTVELIDDLVAAVWRLGEGQPVRRDAVLEEVQKRLRAAPDQHEPRALMAALFAAHLVRWHDPGLLEVPSAWREGLLLPMRRVVLALAAEDRLTWAVDHLRKLHREGFYRILASGRFERRLEFLSSADSWDWVKRSLRDGLGAVEERTAQRPDGSRHARWTLVGVPFVTATIATARRVRARLDAGSDRPEAQLFEGLEHPARWLRCLAGARLITHDRRRGWINTEAPLHDA